MDFNLKEAGNIDLIERFVDDMDLLKEFKITSKGLLPILHFSSYNYNINLCNIDDIGCSIIC